MSNYLCRTRAVSSLVLVLIFLLGNSLGVRAKTVRPKAHPPQKSATDTSREKKFFVDLLHDQRAIWTAPFHLHEADAKWLAPLGAATITLMATDRRSAGELIEGGDHPDRVRISRDISRLGSWYATGGFAGVLYLAGRATHNDRLRETGLLGAEALIDSAIVGGALKLATQRQRPPVDNASGEFFAGGSSFPSGHAASAWSLATIVAQEYGHHRPLVQAGAYGLAAAVSVSRYTARKHFLSDVLVGSALGYGIGRFVYHKHHNPELDARAETNGKQVAQSKWFPSIAPLYYPRAHVYGGMLAWKF